ncbi:MAG: IS200/IS605 family transposase ISAsp8 [Chroococcopsis gigantea SAG 12.99]|nr:transposase [Chlorogloea purpurea SAG 13.99]MDV3000460.1 IS200/IS605 family transposase ISAsp8 [Chroococcopsis gigantea SAG 12.99]
MFLNQTNRLNLSQSESDTLRHLCHLSKNMFNVGLFNVRQYFFQERRFLQYEGNYHYSKENENYKALATDIAQQTLKVVDRSFRSFFNLLQMKKCGEVAAKVGIPNYLPKDGHFLVIIPIRGRDLKDRLPKKDWMFTVPSSRVFRREHGTVSFQIPERLRDKVIKEIRILPKLGARYFDVSYVYEAEPLQQVEPTSHVLGIDLGLNNLATYVSTTGKSFIIDGRKLKSINQWYNKRNAFLQSIKDIQGIKSLTNRQAGLLDKRNHQVSDYLNKSARSIVDWCRSNQISKIVVGYNPDLKQSVNMGTRNNQNFTQIPIFTLKRKLESLCERYGIEVAQQEESYTSKASALDNDAIPIWNADNPQTYKFSGKRIKRGLYRTAKGWLVNADCNGAANILVKHFKSSLDELCFGLGRSALAAPLRVKIS